MLNRRTFLRATAVLGVVSTTHGTSTAEDHFTSPQKVTTDTAEHYQWGGTKGTDCEAWHLVKTPQLSIIEELMPSGTQETPHVHSRARQFFFVLEGELTVVVDQRDIVVLAGQGLEVSPGKIHQAINRGRNPTRMIVTSQPPSHGDRIEA